MAAGSVSIKDRMAKLQKPDSTEKEQDDGLPKTFKTFKSLPTTSTNNKPTQPAKSKSGRFTRRLSMERIASALFHTACFCKQGL